MRPPLHVVPDRPGHGVVRCAREVAEAVGAEMEDDLGRLLAASPRRVHVHVTDRLFGATCEEAAAVLVDIAGRHPMTVTLHDVPQPGDGAAFARRATAYAAVLAACVGWVTNSEHERSLVERHVAPGTVGRVIPLPVVSTGPSRGPGPVGGGVVGILGWVYPGKGHREVIEAASGLPGPVLVRAVGAASPGHEDLLAELAAVAREGGVGFEATGYVADGQLPAALAAVTVPVAAHRHVSASGSINSWLAAGRRPLVSDSPYAREMAALRPGTLTLVEEGGLRDALRGALDDPASTLLDEGVSLAPGLAEVAADYERWWRHVLVPAREVRR